MIRFFAFLFGLRSWCYHRGDGYSILSRNVCINLRTCLDLLESEAFSAISNLVDSPLGIVFEDSPEDGLNVKVFRKRSKYWIHVYGSRPEAGLASGLDSLWRYLANVGPEA
jgi:hypothetical protein